MRFFTTSFVVAILVILIVFNVFAADRLITIDESDFQVTRAVVRAIEVRGGRVKIVVPPHFIVADIPEAAMGRVVLTPSVSGMFEEAVDPADFARFGKHAGHIATAWNNVFMGQAGLAGLEEAPSPDRMPLVGDVKVDERPGLLLNPPGAKWYDTSEFLLGDVGLGVVLPESNGAIDPETEDWTTSEKNNVTSEILNGLNWYVTKAKWRDLTFYAVFWYDVPTGYEPITRSTPPQDGTWIAECLAYLGATASRGLCNRLRDSLDIDWGVINYTVDSSNDGDNQFAGGGFAYSYLGGPYFVMTYGNDGWGIGNMDAVMAHELGHSFYALDEYSGGGEGCAARSGYLAYENQNSCEPSGCGGCASNSFFCIMRSVGLGSAQVCTYTKGQVGWIDSDGDSITDINDTYPETWLYAYAPDPCTTFTPVYAGSSEVMMLPNLNPRGKGHDITLNRIQDVEWRVDEGPWASATPNDGAFDGRREGYHFTTDPLTAGTHIVETRALHTYGNYDTSLAADTLTVDPGSGIGGLTRGATLAVEPYPNPFGPRVDVSYSIPGDYGQGVAVSMRVYDVRGREVVTLMDAVRGPGPGRLSWDGTYANGSQAPSGIYFINLVAGRDRAVEKVVMTR